jgi:uncharacterized membrane protein YdbT with pleckstrin-like domain
MGYARSNLIRGEQIVHTASLHWFMFLGPAFWLTAGGVATLVEAGLNAQGSLLVLGGSVVAAVNTLRLIGRYVDYISTEFVVTNLRVIAKRGFLRRLSVEQMLPKIDALAIDQGIVGRILGFGSVGVSTGGSTQVFPWITDPLGLRRVVQECQSDSYR